MNIRHIQKHPQDSGILLNVGFEFFSLEQEKDPQLSSKGSQKQTKGSRCGGCTSPAEAVCFFSCVSLYVHFQEDMDQYMGQVLRSLSSPYLLTWLSETDKSIEQWRAHSLLFGNGGATSGRHRSEISQGLKTVLSRQRAELLIHTRRRVMFPCQHGELLRDSQWIREDVYQHVNEGLQNEQISLDVLKNWRISIWKSNQKSKSVKSWHNDTLCVCALPQLTADYCEWFTD